jgi:hypothetical protein
MTNIVIHYSGPTDDVPTVPRPTRINLATRAVANAGATAGLQFLGIHPDRNDPTAASGYVDWFEIRRVVRSVRGRRERAIHGRYRDRANRHRGLTQSGRHNQVHDTDAECRCSENHQPEE